ncbi:MAG: hypothetical protein J6X55_15465, partial [Victivallales bacterium]|nr:hypothetical protein [Victivallales bacterium]
ARCNTVLGLKLTAAEMADCFRRRGMEILNETADAVTVRAPGWRFDIVEEHDLWEEVAQMVGLDSIPEAPVSAKLIGNIKDDKFIPIETARKQLLALGLDEIMNYTMFSLPQCLLGSDLAEENIVRVSNPISIDLAYMRPTMLPGMMQVVSHNVSRNEHNLRMFETGRVFRQDAQGMHEYHQVGIVMTGRRIINGVGAEKDLTIDFYDMKGVLEGWFAERRQDIPRWEPAESSAFKKGACAEWKVKGRRLAIFGQASDELVKGIRLRNPLFVALIDFDYLKELQPAPISYKALPQFPGTARDFSFVAPSDLTHQKIVDTIKALNIPVLESVELFDIFEDEKVLGSGKRSMSYSVTFRNAERTLTDDEANAMQEKIRKTLADKLGVELR